MLKVPTTPWCRPTLLSGCLVPDEPWGPDGPVLRTMQRANGPGLDAFCWELAARNGRVLARSTEAFGDRQTAREDFADVAALASELTLTVEHVGASSMWHWRLVDSRGATLLRSPRRYERHGSCNRSGRLMQNLLGQTISRT